MLDAPPVIEIAAGAVAALAAMLVCAVGPAAIRRPMAWWVIAASVAFVARGEAGPTLLLVVLVALGADVPRVVNDVRAQRALREWGPAVGLVGVPMVTVGTESRELVSAAVVTSVLLWPLLRWMLRIHGPKTLAFVLGATTLGIYANVPDTEQITILGAGLGILAVAQLAIPSLRDIGWGSAAVAVVGALVAGAGAWGAIGRPASYVAVVGALGVLIAEPLAGSIRRTTRAKPAVLVALHAVAAIGVSRAAGREPVAGAVPIVVGTLIALVLALLVLPRNDHSNPPEPELRQGSEV